MPTNELIKEIKKNLDAAKKQVEAYTYLLESHGVEDIDPSPMTIALQRNKVSFALTAEKSLRHAISSILKQNKEGVSTGTITDILQTSGFKVGGKTKLNSRVSLELYQMKKLGLVKKSGNKYKII